MREVSIEIIFTDLQKELMELFHKALVSASSVA